MIIGNVILVMVTEGYYIHICLDKEVYYYRINAL